jgi:hypothetical protein
LPVATVRAKGAAIAGMIMAKAMMMPTHRAIVEVFLLFTVCHLLFN